MKLNVLAKDGVVHVSVGGRVDVLESDKLVKDVEQKINADNKNVEFDFTNLEFISSDGLGALLRIRSFTKKFGGDIKIYCAPERIRDVFKTTKLDQLFTILPCKS